MPNFRRLMIDGEAIPYPEEEYDRDLLDGGTLGNTADIPITALNQRDQIASILDISGDPRRGRGMCVTLARPSPPLVEIGGEVPTNYFFPVALIEFGNEGFRTAVEVDYVNGAHIFVPASSVRVSAFQEDISTFSVAPSIAEQRLSAFIDYYPPARRSKVYRTQRALITAPGGGSTSLQPRVIPAFASSLEVMRQPYTNAFHIDLYNSAGFIVYSEDVPASTRHVPIPLAGDAIAAIITTLTGPVSYRFIYEIGI